MEKIPYREHHLLSLLEEYENKNIPLDVQIRNYFQAHRSLGSKDRGEIAENVYGIIRWQKLLDYIYRTNGDWEKRYEGLKTLDIESILKNDEIPIPIRLSIPERLYELLLESHGKEKAEALCLECNFPAPTMVRINPLKTTREKMLELWENEFQVSPSEHSKYGILFEKKTALFSLPEFQNGMFEMQDEGSQILADMMDVKPGNAVMDYCAGSGGKTLAFAHKMNQKGQVYLHDIRSHALKEAKIRLRRAGIQNAQIVEYEDPKLQKLKKKMDWVLVDAPCSGTGTYRRNPDMKWKFTEEMLRRLIGEQRSIFEKALSFLKPNGTILYATCSLLNDENQGQVEHFLKTYDLELVAAPFQSYPERGKMDGFFGALMKRKRKQSE